jgi:hypothetical protein
MVGQQRWGIALFWVVLAGMAVGLHWNYWRQQTTALTPDEVLQRQIVADLSNLPPHLGDPQAPIVICVALDPKHGGPCTKGTAEFVRQLVRDYPGKVQAFFRKVHHHKDNCAAELTINGKKTFTLLLNGRPQTITLQGTARPGDPMSFLIRQIIEQELAKARREVKDAEAIKKSEPPSS